MSAFENATALFHACESLKGWDGCSEYAVEDAGFSSQSEPIAQMTTLADYANWFQGVGTGPLSGVSYQMNASGYDAARNQAIFFGTVTATHNGEGAPVPPTGKTTVSEYVYVMQMNDAGKVTHMTKIWNSNWAFAELGWA